MAKKALFFVSKDCPGCLDVKKIVRKQNIDYRKYVREVDVDTPEGGKLADKFNVRSIPSCVDADGKLCSMDAAIDVLMGTCKKC